MAKTLRQSHRHHHFFWWRITGWPANMESIRGFSGSQFGKYQPLFVPTKSSFKLFVPPNNRVPFDMNTTIRCATMATFQTISIMCIMHVFCVLFTLLYGFTIYTEACLADMKLLFDEVTRLSLRRKSKPSAAAAVHNCEYEVLVLCKDAIGLHVRLNRYGVKHH